MSGPASPNWERPAKLDRVDSSMIRTDSPIDGAVPGQEVHMENRRRTFEGKWANNEDSADDEVSCTWSPDQVCYDCLGWIDNHDGVKCVCCGVWTLIILILAIILIVCSVETIDSTEMGIAYNSPQAILTSEVKEEGLHSKPPFGHFILWPRTHQTMSQNLTARSRDGVTVTCTVAFQYKVNEKDLHALTMDYRSFDFYSSILRLQSRSGIRNACMKFTAQEFQTKRAAVQAKMADAVSQRLGDGGMHAVVYELQLTNIDRPAAYEVAVGAKEKAKSTIDLVSNQKAQRVTAATTSKMRATVEANKTLDAANTAAVVTKKNAESEAAIVYGRYASQGQLYSTVRAERNLTSQGLLSYIGTRLIDELEGLMVGIAAPARVSYGSALSNRTSIV